MSFDTERGHAPDYIVIGQMVCINWPLNIISYTDPLKLRGRTQLISDLVNAKTLLVGQPRKGPI